MGEDGTCHVCWQEFKNRHDAVYAGRLEAGCVQEKTRISGEGEALRPVICAHGHAIWYAWSESDCGNWQILARYYKDGRTALSLRSQKERRFFIRSSLWKGTVWRWCTTTRGRALAGA